MSWLGAKEGTPQSRFSRQTPASQRRLLHRLRSSARHPIDLLDRVVFLLLPTRPYGEKELRSILTIRCEEEDVEMGAEATDLLTRIARDTSLRYAMQMIMCAALVAKTRRAPAVDVDDIRRVYGLFSDLRRSTQFLLEHNREFMFNEYEGGAGGDEEGEGAEGRAPLLPLLRPWTRPR